VMRVSASYRAIVRSWVGEVWDVGWDVRVLLLLDFYFLFLARETRGFASRDFFYLSCFLAFFLIFSV
jgi:hypothetical protein